MPLVIGARSPHGKTRGYPIDGSNPLPTLCDEFEPEMRGRLDEVEARPAWAEEILGPETT